jgi:hypothetical protein
MRLQEVKTSEFDPNSRLKTDLDFRRRRPVQR